MRKPSSSHPNLTPQTKDFLRLMEERPLPSIEDYVGLRKAFDELQSNSAYDIPAQIEDIVLPIGPSDNLFVRIVKPENAQGILPMIFYIHGGGWMMGSTVSHDRLIRTIADCTNSIVVFPSYSLSPEVQFPTAVNECYEALKYFASNADKYNINPNKIAVAGDSAGANMATVMTIKAHQENGPKIIFQALFYPITNLNLEGESMEEFSEGPWLTKKSLEKYRECYLEKKEDKFDIFASPFMASKEILGKLPSALIITDENDPLRDDGEAYAAKLNSAGVEVASVRYNGTIHSFMVLNGLKDTVPAKRAVEQACNILKNVLHGQF